MTHIYARLFFSRKKSILSILPQHNIEYLQKTSFRFIFVTFTSCGLIRNNK